MIDCLARFASILEPSQQVSGASGPLDAVVEHTMREKLVLAAEHGFAFHAGADAVTASCSRCLARGALPRHARVRLRLPATHAHHLEDIVLGVASACRAHGLALLAAFCEAADGPAITVAIAGRPVLELRPPRAGDVIVGLAANGLHESDHRAALDVAATSGPARQADLQRIFTPQKSYQGVLYEPLRQGWFGSALAVDDRGLGEATTWDCPRSTRRRRRLTARCHSASPSIAADGCWWWRRSDKVRWATPALARSRLTRSRTTAA